MKKLFASAAVAFALAGNAVMADETLEVGDDNCFDRDEIVSDLSKRFNETFQGTFTEGDFTAQIYANTDVGSWTAFVQKGDRACDIEFGNFYNQFFAPFVTPPAP